MFKLVSLSLLASAIALSPASAQGTAKASSDGAAAAAAAAAEKKVCKRVLRSGTNARPKICLTKAEWKKVDDNQH